MATVDRTTTTNSDIETSQVSAATTVDCLPPPYSVTETAATTRTLGYRRTESTEHIVASGEDGDCEEKLCCSRLHCRLCLTGCLQFKKVLLFLALSVMGCVLTSITLGVIQIPKSSHITLSLLFAGKHHITLSLLFANKCHITLSLLFAGKYRITLSLLLLISTASHSHFCLLVSTASRSHFSLLVSKVFCDD